MSTPEEGAYIYASFEKALETCTTPWVLSWSTKLPGVSIKLHELMIILAAVALIWNSLLALYLIWGHCFHWCKPTEQKQIIRILVFVPFMSICAFVSVWSYPSSGYIGPIGEYYEGFAITCLFLLYVQMVCPNLSDREIYFAHLERRWISGKVKKGSKGSLRWFRVLWAMVFQVTLVRIGAVIAEEVLWGVTCPLSNARKWGYVGISIIQGLSTMSAVMACIIFEKRMRPQLAGHQGFFKLVSFKLVVGLDSTQQILFSVLAQKEVFYPSEPFRVSYMDFSKGLPNLIFLYELAVVAFIFLWSFSFEEYMQAVRQGTPVEASAGHALLSSYKTVDIFQGLAYAFTGWTQKGDYHDVNLGLIEQNDPSAREDDNLKDDNKH